MILASNDTQMVTRKCFTVPGTESILISSRNVIIRSAKAVTEVGDNFPFSTFTSILYTHTLISVLPLHSVNVQFVLK